jgi:pimeloyl-ACP methyl ester carboxylesterase
MEKVGVESKTIEVNGIRMRWEEHGQGVPVVFVHGIPTCPGLWRRMVPRLEGVRALAWEMVGYGASIPEGRDRDISVGRQAEYLVQWLQALGVERAVLAGHDLGGGVVQIAAVRNPGLCRGLFLTNAIGYDSWPIPSVDVVDTFGGLVEHFPKPVFKPIFSGFLRMGHDDQEIAAESIEIHWSNYDEHDGAEAFIRQVRSLNVHDTLAVRDDLPKLDVPARVVWGEADFFQKVRFGEFFARDLNTELQRIPGGKHFTPEDHPDAVAAAINDLVREIHA